MTESDGIVTTSMVTGRMNVGTTSTLDHWTRKLILDRKEISHMAARKRRWLRRVTQTSDVHNRDSFCGRGPVTACLS